MAVSKITNEHLDELVCGDVPPLRYREILTQLDAEPEKWRDCALAFLQEQAIESEMRQLALDDANWGGSVESEGEQRAAAATPVQVASRGGRSETEHLRKLQRWTSIAASVLIAFSVGWVGSGFMSEPANTSAGATNQETSSANPAVLAGGSNIPDSRASLRPDYSPAETTFASTESLVLDNEVPAELLKLERLGYRIESKSRLVPVNLKDGTQAIVPIKTYRALPPALPY
ncbi:MAG: hypothetical protein Aurels2KO_13740 [Aureliella sp.]